MFGKHLIELEFILFCVVDAAQDTVDPALGRVRV